MRILQGQELNADAGIQAETRPPAVRKAPSLTSRQDAVEGRKYVRYEVLVLARNLGPFGKSMEGDGG